MGIFDSLFGKKNTGSAQTAKERLKIVVAHQRDAARAEKNPAPAFMEEMTQEILTVVKKYFVVSLEDIDAKLEHDNAQEILSLNINLQDKRIV